MRPKTHLRKPHTRYDFVATALCGRYVDPNQITVDRPTCRKCRKAAT